MHLFQLSLLSKNNKLLFVAVSSSAICLATSRYNELFWGPRQRSLYREFTVNKWRTVPVDFSHMIKPKLIQLKQFYSNARTKIIRLHLEKRLAKQNCSIDKVWQLWVNCTEATRAEKNFIKRHYSVRTTYKKMFHS